MHIDTIDFFTLILCKKQQQRSVAMTQVSELGSSLKVPSGTVEIRASTLMKTVRISRVDYIPMIACYNQITTTRVAYRKRTHVACKELVLE